MKIKEMPIVDDMEAVEESVSFDLYKALKESRGYPGIPLQTIAAQIFLALGKEDSEALAKLLK